MKTIYRTVILSILSYFYASSYAIENKREYIKSFETNTSSRLFVKNKYGDILLNIWNNDYVEIMVTVTNKISVIKDDDKDILDKVSIEFSKKDNEISAITNYRKGYLFSKLYMELIKKGDIKTDYITNAPAYLHFNVDLKKGNLTINEPIKYINLKHQGGILQIKKLTGEDNNFNLKNVDAFFNYIDNAIFHLAWCNFTSSKAENIDITSHSSKINISEINNLQINTFNDKIKLTKCNTIKGNSKLSVLIVQNLKTEVTLKSLFGKVNFENVSQTIENIRFKLLKTQTFLNFKNPSCLNLRIHHNKNANLHINKNIDMQMKFAKIRRHFVSITKPSHAACKHMNKVFINIKNGNLSIND